MRLSIVCPVYNTPAQLLIEAVASAFVQDAYQECEVILVDDASTSQDTIGCLQSLEVTYERIALVRLETNRGPSSARASGIRAASGNWIGFLDSDDRWLPGALQQFRRAMEIAPEARWIVGYYQILREGWTIERNPSTSDEVVKRLLHQA